MLPLTRLRSAFNVNSNWMSEKNIINLKRKELTKTDSPYQLTGAYIKENNCQAVGSSWAPNLLSSKNLFLWASKASEISEIATTVVSIDSWMSGSF